MRLHFSPGDKGVGVVIARVMMSLALRYIIRAGVKPETQGAKAPKGDITPLGLDHSKRYIGVAAVQIDGSDIGHQLKPDARVLRMELWQCGQNQRRGQVFSRG